MAWVPFSRLRTMLRVFGIMVTIFGIVCYMLLVTFFLCRCLLRFRVVPRVSDGLVALGVLLTIFGGFG